MVHVMTVSARLMNAHVFLHVFLIVVVVVIDDGMVWCARRDWRWNLLSVGHGRHAVMRKRRKILIIHRWRWCGCIGGANYSGLVHGPVRQIGLKRTQFCGVAKKKNRKNLENVHQNVAKHSIRIELLFTICCFLDNWQRC